MLSNKIHYLLLNLLLFTNAQIVYFKRPLSTRSPEESGDIYKEKNTNSLYSIFLRHSPIGRFYLPYCFSDDALNWFVWRVEMDY